MQVRDEDIELPTLTQIPRQLVRAIGVAATIKLLQGLGGTRLFFSEFRRGGRDWQKVRDLVGKESADAVYAAFKGNRRDLSLPKADKILIQLRDRAIRADRRRGLTIESLAVRYNMTRRHVSTICGRPEMAPARHVQGDLFGYPPETV